jgi:hypothetical protein
MPRRGDGLPAGRNGERRRVMSAIGGLLIFAWVIGSLFAATIGGRAQGVGGFFGWGLTSLLVSPLLALLGLVVVMQREQAERLKDIREHLVRTPARP